MGPMRRAGLRGDHAQIPGMIAVLQEKPTPSPVLLRTTLHSLAQLGATNALPSIDNLIQSSTDKNIVAYAQVARARLLAESSINADASEDAKVMLDNFYQQLHESPMDINASVSAYRENLKQHPPGPDAVPLIPTELYAMRELADMDYENQSSSFATLPGITQVNFTLDSRSNLKVRLAPLSSPERIAWLIQDLAHKTTLSNDEFAEIQLTGDLGPDAGKAAAAKLQVMEQQKNLASRAAFNALFGVIAMSGDKEKILWKHFENNSDPYIAEYARRRGAGGFVEGY